jgi:hypothetical protein
MGDAFTPPVAETGDPIHWYADPLHPRDPCVGWISGKPGAVTNTLLVFLPNIGWTEKPSVRHMDDPGLIENPNWRQWGCWDFAPWFVSVKKITANMAKTIAASEKGAKRGTAE